jgi:hypothetical protein
VSGDNAKVRGHFRCQYSMPVIDIIQLSGGNGMFSTHVDMSLDPVLVKWIRDGDV